MSRREVEVTEAQVRVVRTGHGANCSSIGSVIDTLFATATLGSAVFAAVLAALKKEDVKVVGTQQAPPEPPGETPPAEAS
jgi:hypothetical protein